MKAADAFLGEERSSTPEPPEPTEPTEPTEPRTAAKPFAESNLLINWSSL